MESALNLYRVLGIPMCSPIEEVRQAYISRLKKIKPSADSGNIEAILELSILVDAFKPVSTPCRKKGYDFWLISMETDLVSFKPDIMETIHQIGKFNYHHAQRTYSEPISL